MARTLRLLFEFEREFIRTATLNGVATIEIARPEKKNALTAAMYQAMADALRAAQADAGQADAEMLRARTRVELEAERARRALAAAGQQLAMAVERRALAADNLRLAEKAFTLGESDLSALLRIRAMSPEERARALERRKTAAPARVS